MISNSLKLALVFSFLILGCSSNKAQQKSVVVQDFNALSENFLLNIKNGEDTKKIQDQLANTTLEALEEGLQTDEQKLAFWINIYNAYIQVFLSKNPELYDNRQAFFNDERILIAGKKRSFAKIEHGIIRKSQWSLGLGIIRKPFPNKFERKLRVDKRDYRIHFALNCGAKDCPPVTIYTPDRIQTQLKEGTVRYLKRSTTYDKQSNTVAVTSLFSWFRGDFGNAKGTKNILRNQGLIPSTKVNLEYKNYDWTLDLENWIDL